MAIKIVRKIHHTGKDIEMSKPAPIEETKKSQKSQRKQLLKIRLMTIGLMITRLLRRQSRVDCTV